MLYGEEAAKARGTNLHLLLEHLPAQPEDRWPDLARALLAGEPTENNKTRYKLRADPDFTVTPGHLVPYAAPLLWLLYNRSSRRDFAAARLPAGAAGS